MQVKIVSATPDQAFLVSTLAAVTFRASFGHLFPKDVLDRYINHTFSVQKIERSIRKPDNRYYLATAAGDAVGYLKLKRQSERPEWRATRQGQLQKLYVLESSIGQGIGLALVEHCHQEARLVGCEHLWLSVLQSNHRALRFYRRAGYSPLGSQHHQIEHLRFDYLVMGITLPVAITA